MTAMSLKIHSHTQFTKAVWFLFFSPLLLFSGDKCFQLHVPLNPMASRQPPSFFDYDAILYSAEMALTRACDSHIYPEWWMSPSYGGRYMIGTFWKDFLQTFNRLTWTQLKTDPELDRLYPSIVSNYIDNNFLNGNWRNIMLCFVLVRSLVKILESGMIIP